MWVESIMVKKYLETAIKLSVHELEEIKRFAPPQKFGKGIVTTIYKGQIPISGYVVYEGCLILTDKKRKSFVKPGQMIFLEDSFFKRSVSFDVLIDSESVIGFLDRSSVLEMTNSKDSILHTNAKLSLSLQIILQHAS